MRLHLPRSLRVAMTKILLTTALIPATVGSYAFGVLVFTTDETGTILTVSLPSTIVAEVFNTQIAANSNYTSSTTTKLVFNFASTTTNIWFSDNWTISKAVQIGIDGATDTGLRIYNGSSNKTLTLSGPVSGTGTISLAGGASKYVLISGDTSEFNGNIVMNNSTASYLTFGNGSTTVPTSNTETKGAIGNGTVTLTSASYDFLRFNYSCTDSVYITNTFTGAGVVQNLGTASLIFTKNITSALTFSGNSGAGGISFSGNVSSSALTVNTVASTFNGNITSAFTYSGSGNAIFNGSINANLTFNGTGSATFNSALTTGTLTIGTSASGTHDFHQGGTLTAMSLQAGTNNLYGTFTLTGNIIGGNNSVSTINIGNTDGTKTASVKAVNFYGHYEHASTAANANISTINVNKGSTLNITTLLQIARDGKAILNIAEGGTVIATRIDMGTNQSDWTGTPSDGKQATLNLNGGKLILGANGITQTYNSTSSPGVLNLNSGTLGGSANWSTSLNINGESSGESSLTVQTNAFQVNQTFGGEGITITLGTMTTTSGHVLEVQGSGSLVLGANSALQTVKLTNGSSSAQADSVTASESTQTISTGSTLMVGSGTSIQSLTLSLGSTLGLNSDSSNGTLTISNLTDASGKFLINLGDGSSDKITADSYTGSLTLAISGGVSGQTYNIFQGASSLALDNVTLDTTGLSGRLKATKSIDENGLVSVLILGGVDWNGTEESHVWSTSESDMTWEYQGTSGYFCNSDVVTFSGDGYNEVTISGNVAPTSITVSGSKDYTFSGDGSITGTTTLDLNLEEGHKLTVSTANSYTGATTLTSGTLVLNNESALGTSSLVFAGGTLEYGTGITTDISARISTSSASPLKVNTNGNDITWNWGASGLTTASLGALTMEKSGQGTLTITLPNTNNLTMSGPITVSEGKLVYQIATAGNARTFSGGINLSEGATIQFIEKSTDTTIHTTLSGRVTGTGTLIIGDNSTSETNPGGGRFLVSGDNSGFTGNLVLSGNGTNATWNEVGFTYGSSLGNGTLTLDGKGLFINTAGQTIAANIVVADAGSWFDGNSGQTQTFTGSLSSSENANLAVTSGGNPTTTLIFTGDLTKFLGTLTTKVNTTSTAATSFTFGNGGVATLDTDGNFFGAKVIAGPGSVTVNYSGTEGGKIGYAGSVTGDLTLNVSGADTLVLKGSSTATGATLNIVNANSSVQLGTSDVAATWAGSTLSGNGTFTLVNGTLTSAITKSSGAAAKLVVNAAENAVINAGGTTGSTFSSIALGSGARLTNVSGDITLADGATESLSITLSTAYVGQGAAASSSLIDHGTSSTLALTDASKLNLNIAGITDLLTTSKSSTQELWITLSSGTLSCDELQNISFNTTLDTYGWELGRVDGGSLVLTQIVPEPSAFAFTLLAALGLCKRRRV